ncbi:MAG TPA: YcgL domain-containing protein [Chromatiales bacterium]|nr:YcgL domain-containing protein [Chromatiales bacterium]
MQCFVYRSSRKADTYVYLPRRDDFSDIPEELMRILGRLEFALEFELTPERKLAQEDPVQVLRSLQERGFHLQMPPQNETPL